MILFLHLFRFEISLFLSLFVLFRAKLSSNFATHGLWIADNNGKMSGYLYNENQTRGLKCHSYGGTDLVLRTRRFGRINRVFMYKTLVRYCSCFPFGSSHIEAAHTCISNQPLNNWAPRISEEKKVRVEGSVIANFEFHPVLCVGSSQPFRFLCWLPQILPRECAKVLMSNDHFLYRPRFRCSHSGRSLFRMLELEELNNHFVSPANLKYTSNSGATPCY